MGRMSIARYAYERIANELHFAIVSGDSQFLAVLDKAGKRRFDIAMQAMRLWQRPHHTGRQKYDQLTALLRLMTPDKRPGTKYRNPHAQAAYGYGRELDGELDGLINGYD